MYNQFVVFLEICKQLSYGRETMRRLSNDMMYCVQMCRVSDFKEVGHFEAKFQVEALRFAPISMDRQMGEWLYYNFAAGSFHTKKLGSRLYSIEIEFYF